MSPVIEVHGLQRSYGDRRAVDGLDLSVERGEIRALLGPNGAGKTTSVEILEGFRRRDAGEVSVLGVDPAVAGPAWRDRVGIVPQDSQAFEGLTVAETLDHLRACYSKPLSLAEVLDRLELTAEADQRVERLSGGQRRRLDVAAGLVGRPEVLFLDEPTTGLDPEVRRRLWELIRGLRDLGTTILLTTHYLDEADALADTVTVLSAGRVIAEGDPRTLGGRAAAAALVRFRLSPTLAAAKLPSARRLGGSTDVGSDGLVTVTTSRPTAAVTVLAEWAAGLGEHELPELEVAHPSLEDVYLDLIATPTEVPLPPPPTRRNGLAPLRGIASSSAMEAEEVSA